MQIFSVNSALLVRYKLYLRKTSVFKARRRTSSDHVCLSKSVVAGSPGAQDLMEHSALRVHNSAMNNLKNSN